MLRLSKITHVVIGLSLGLLLSTTAVHAETISMQEALVELNEAVQFYQMGDRPMALQTFLSITTEPSYPVTIQQEARIYIAEIMLVEGNVDDARSYFHEVLDINPSYSIDRFRHPPEVCTEFDYTNAQWKQRQPPPPIVASKQSFYTLAPFGIYQFQRKETWKGVAYSGLQLGTAITSVTLFSYLQQNPGYNQNDLDEKARLERILTVQRASAIGFYALWLMSSIDAQRDWQLEEQ